MRLNANGNVGIGTASPSFKLDVSGAIQSSVASGNGSVYFNNGSLSGKFWTAIPVTSAGESNLEWYYGGTSATRVTFTNIGTVGIGSNNPYSILEASQTNAAGSTALTLTNTSTANNTTKLAQVLFRLTDTVGTIKEVGYVRSIPEGADAINASLAFAGRASDAVVERMRIVGSSGNVGIGTTTPNTRLDVNGNTTITGSLILSSSLYSSLGSSAAVGTTAIVSTATGSYRAGFFDYTIASASNARAGTVMSVWNGNNVQFTDNSTLDIGSTSAVTMSVDLSGGNVRLLAGSTSGTWDVKTTYRLI
jgi:hypothetical protein